MLGTQYEVRAHPAAQSSVCICLAAANRIEKIRFQRNSAGDLTNEQLKNETDMPREAIRKGERRKSRAKLSYANAGAVGAGPRAFASRVLTR